MLIRKSMENFISIQNKNILQFKKELETA